MSLVPDGFLTSESDSEPDFVFDNSRVEEVYLKMFHNFPGMYILYKIYFFSGCKMFNSPPPKKKIKNNFICPLPIWSLRDLIFKKIVHFEM